MIHTSPEKLHEAIHLVVPKEELSALIGGPLATATGLAFQTMAGLTNKDKIDYGSWVWSAISDGVLLHKAGWLKGQKLNSL